MKGIKKMVHGSLFLDKRVKSASQNLQVLISLEKNIISNSLVISRAIAKKLLLMLDEEMGIFAKLPIANENNEPINGWTFLHAAVHSSIEVRPNKSIKFQPSTMTISLANGYEEYFTKAEEIFDRLNKAWEGYVKIKYLYRAGNTMVVEFKLVP